MLILKGCIKMMYHDCNLIMICLAINKKFTENRSLSRVFLAAWEKYLDACSQY